MKGEHKMMQDAMVELTLKEMTDLDRQFQKLLPAVVASLKDETQSASITITMSFKLCPDSETQFDMKTSIKPTFATDKRTTRCRRDLLRNIVTADSFDPGTERPLCRTESQHCRRSRSGTKLIQEE